MCRDFLEMGTLGRAHGIKGEIGVEWFGEFAPAIKTPIFLAFPDGGRREYIVSGARAHNGRLLLSLAGVTDRDKAEALRGARILLPRDSLPPLENDEAYLEDLPGLAVYLADGEFLGLIDHLEFPAGQDLWVIRDEGKADILFPAAPEFIKSLDIEKHKIIIDPPPGLVEVYRE